MIARSIVGAIQTYSRGGHHDRKHCCTTSQQTGRQGCDSPVSGEFSGNGAYRIAEAHQRNQVAGTGNSHGCNARRAARDYAEPRALLGDRLRLAQVRGETERAAAIHHRDRWARHSFHSRPFKTRKCVAADRYARMARLDHRSVDQSHGTWRERIGRFPPGDSVDTRLRVFRQADHHRLGPRAHRASMGRAHETPWLHKICGARRRLGCGHHRTNGCAGGSGIARHSHQYAWRGSGRHRQGGIHRCANARRSLTRRETSLRAADIRLQQRHRLRLPDGAAPPDVVRNCGLPRRPGRLFPGPRCVELRADLTRLFRRSCRPHPGRCPRQHHDHLVDEHGDFRSTPLLGKQTPVFQCQRRFHPGCRKRLSGRDRSVPAQLGGAGVSQTDPLQQARQRRALCGLGTAATLFRRGSRGLQIAALDRAAWRRVRRTRRLPLGYAATTENSEKVRRSESRNYLPGPDKPGVMARSGPGITSAYPVAQSPRRQKRPHVTTACRALSNTRGKVRLFERKGSAITMTKDDIQLLFEFERWANNMVLQAASTLNAEEFTRDLGGSFRSVRDTLVHIVGVERGWLTCWKEPSPSSTFVKDYWTRHNALFNPNAFPDLAAVQLKWAEIEREQVEFVNRVTNESSGRMLPVYAKQISLAHLMQHLANHSTYHRGQVSLMMRQLAAGPVATDFALFLMEGRCEAATAR